MWELTESEEKMLSKKAFKKYDITVKAPYVGDDKYTVMLEDDGFLTELEVKQRIWEVVKSKLEWSYKKV